MQRLTVLALSACVLAVPASAPVLARESAPDGVKVVLELNQRFYYAGDPFPVRISIGNEGAEKVSNPLKKPLFRGFEVRTADGEILEPSGDPGVAEPSRPDKLAPASFYGAVVDLTRIYPDLREVGQYEVRWAASGIESETIVVRMIPRYDPSKSHVVRLSTTEGVIVIELLKNSAPLAVKNFVDLAHAGFYDDRSIFEVRPDAFIVGGGYSGYTFPAELTPVAVVAGTVLLKPASLSPPANGAEFIIALRPEPGWTGQLTVVGQVVEGLDVARKISRLPSTGQAGKPRFKPLTPILIRDVTISEKPEDGNGPQVPRS
jgi:cyclophilin family peptidyl-prolyl cis-trans isomerase